MEIKTLELTQLKLSDLNPRKHYDEAKLKELAASIKEKGIIEPIIVRPSNGKHEIICGARRFKAAQLAGLKDIPALERKLTDQQALEFQVIENLQREDIHPLEEAEGYEILLKKHGYKTVDDIAVKIGKSKGYIYTRLKLCELIPENRKFFYEGKFSPSVALLVARIPAHLQKEAAKELLRGIDDGDVLSYREAQRHIQHNLMLQLKEAQFDTKDKTLCEKSGPCTVCLKRTGNQKELFPDISSADVCTDPVCFNAKKNAFVQHTLAKAKESGKRVLSQADCKKVFPHSYTSNPQGDYIALDDTCYDDAKYRKFSQLAKAVKDAQIIYAVHPEKCDIIELITKNEANRIKKQLGIKGRNADNNSTTHDMAKARKEERIRRLTVSKIADAIVAKIKTDKDMSFLRPFAEACLRSANEATQRLFILRRNPKLKRDQVYDAMKEHLKNISDSELFGFWAEVTICTEAEWRGYGELALNLCKHYKIDSQKIKEAAKKELAK
jgi:ParB/RepB/Spo0J family partition protein